MMVYVTRDEAIDILVSAKQNMNKPNSWCRSQEKIVWSDGETQFCAVGHIGNAVGVDWSPVGGACSYENNREGWDEGQAYVIFDNLDDFRAVKAHIVQQILDRTVIDNDQHGYKHITDINDLKGLDEINRIFDIAIEDVSAGKHDNNLSRELSW